MIALLSLLAKKRVYESGRAEPRFGLQHTTLQVEHARQQRPIGTELPLARG
jgi:hypothetical protein